MHRPPLPTWRYSWCLFLLQAKSRPQGHSEAGTIKSKKNPNDGIGNRTRNLPAVAQCPVTYIIYILTIFYVLASLSTNKPGQAVMALNLYSGNTCSEYRPGLYNPDMLTDFPQFLQHNAATEPLNRPHNFFPQSNSSFITRLTTRHHITCYWR